MQVAPVRVLPDGGKWTYEAKLDSYRCLAARRGSGVVLWSRRGNGFTDRFPQIVRACEKLPADTLIDGEVIVVDENGRCTFNALQHSRPKGHIQLYAFDVLVYRGRNVLRLTDRGTAAITHGCRYPELSATIRGRVKFCSRSTAFIFTLSQLCQNHLLECVRIGKIDRPGAPSDAWIHSVDDR